MEKTKWKTGDAITFQGTDPYQGNPYDVDAVVYIDMEGRAWATDGSNRYPEDVWNPTSLKRSFTRTDTQRLIKFFTSPLNMWDNVRDMSRIIGFLASKGQYMLSDQLREKKRNLQRQKQRLANIVLGDSVSFMLGAEKTDMDVFVDDHEKAWLTDGDYKYSKNILTPPLEWTHDTQGDRLFSYFFKHGEKESQPVVSSVITYLTKHNPEKAHRLKKKHIALLERQREQQQRRKMYDQELLAKKEKESRANQQRMRQSENVGSDMRRDWTCSCPLIKILILTRPKTGLCGHASSLLKKTEKSS